LVTSSSSGFGLSASGRSFQVGSGSNTSGWSCWTALAAVVLLDEDDPPVVKLTNDDDGKIEAIILQQHTAFYQALAV
jgi:hypothetical protein